MEALLAGDDAVSDYPAEVSVVEFMRSLASATTSYLLLDFDGTLAPFEIDPSTVQPWPGVLDLLQQIQNTGRMRIAVVTGRPAEEVRRLLPLHIPPDIWGLHGAERLHPDGRMERDELPSQHSQALIDARELLQSIQLPQGIRMECKWNAVALHWRGIAKRLSQAASEDAESLLAPFAKNAGLQLLPFDGGVELRSGHNKGDAVRRILEEQPQNVPVAYLGDDTTDEDAFQALSGKGLCVLIRPQWRPSGADFWLPSPEHLRRFLAAWLAVLL